MIKRSNVGRWAVLAGLVIFLAGCGKPIPPEYQDYVGTWKNDISTRGEPSEDEFRVHLAVYPGGKISYKRWKSGKKVTINAPIVRFEGDDFVVGFWKLTTVFKVESRPYEAQDDWWMRVDGRDLRRVSEDSLSAPN